jgi:hypothetical protein
MQSPYACQYAVIGGGGGGRRGNASAEPAEAAPGEPATGEEPAAAEPLAASTFSEPALDDAPSPLWPVAAPPPGAGVARLATGLGPRERSPDASRAAGNGGSLAPFPASGVNGARFVRGGR